MYKQKIDAPNDNRANPDVDNSLVVCLVIGALVGTALGYIGHIVLTAIGH